MLQLLSVPSVGLYATRVAYLTVSSDRTVANLNFSVTLAAIPEVVSWEEYRPCIRLRDTDELTHFQHLARMRLTTSFKFVLNGHLCQDASSD